MAKLTQAQILEREETRQDLRKRIKPGTRIYTILRSVSKSGMFRRISLFYIDPKTKEPISLDWSLNRLGIGERWGREAGVGVSGCGMDMGYHLVYSLSSRLYPKGFSVKGIGRNGDTSGWDKDGGYALKHAWV